MLDIKISCDLCKRQIDKDKEGFLFEGVIQQDLAVLIRGTAQKQTQKTVIHICKDCYTKKIKKTIYGESKPTEPIEKNK